MQAVPLKGAPVAKAAEPSVKAREDLGAAEDAA
jgi:hypothetical protein